MNSIGDYARESSVLKEETGNSEKPDAREREVWPLTFQERQMAAEQYLRPDSAAYHINFALRLSGVLDGVKLERSLGAFVERHRIMRSFYPVENGDIVHRVSGSLTVRLEKKICRPEELEPLGLQSLIRSLNYPFDLSNAPLFRFFLIETGKNEHVLILWVHHIIMDGLSFGIFLRELRELYENGGEYRASEVPDGPDYLDYSVWRAGQDASEKSRQENEEHKKFFLDMFADGAPENDMPTKPVRPAKLPAASAYAQRRVDITLLREEAARRGKTTFTFLFSAFALTLAKYCDSGDVVMGVALKGRAPETSGMVGMFVNTLPVRVSIDPNENAYDYAERAARTLDEVKARQFCPLESLTPLLAPDRDESRNPVFDVIVNYIDEYEAFDMGGVSVQALPRTLQELNIDLKLEMIREKNELRAVLLYSPELYDSEVVDGMLTHFESVIGRMSEREKTRATVGEISELPEAHRKRILEDFAGDRSDRTLGRTVVDLFRERAREDAGNRAVLFKDLVLSYGEMDTLTDKLAARLFESGIGRGDWVGVLIRRSEMMPICAMGALKSGAAYVPLDPSYPPERLEFMLRDSGAKTIIADPGLESLIPGFEGTTICTDEIRNKKDSPAHKAPLAASPRPDDPLVLLYTSGTTGQPKGVVLSHANLANFCDWLSRTYEMTREDVVAAYASFGFDACLMDMFPTLTAGAAIDIVPDEMRLDLPRLNDRFNEKGVTIAFMTTQLGRQFAADMRNTSLRALSVGGETLVPIEPPGSFVMYNAYGPTECTILSAFFRVDRLYDRVPLGKPPSNTAIYIVDKSGGLAPIGAMGELCIAGRQVGIGYLNRPELTSEKFVKNPFSDSPDFARMYKTGDVARFLPSGDVDFIGRRDFQVKIRGFRVELSEIELRIREYPGVKDAAVVPFDAPGGGGKCAVAYIVSDSNIDAEELNRFIETKLPPYMIPAAIRQIEAIPLNPNGKVDRKKLPPPVFGASEKTAALSDAAHPGNDLEAVISEVLTDILGHDQFNLYTNLLRAGLTSLAAIRFCSRLDERLGAAPSVPDIMKSPTLLDVENAILRKLLNERLADAALTPGATYDDDTGYPISQSQAGVCFDCMKRPGSTGYNIPFRIRFSPAVDARRLTEAAAAVIDAHPVVKSHLVTVGDEIRQVLRDNPAEVHCDDASDAELEDIVRGFVRPFNLFEGPLYRARVVRTPSGTTLLADFHHIVFDGTSLDIFLRDLGAVFEDGDFLKKNRSAREKISCFDWAAREKSDEGGSDWLADKAYFDEQLTGFEGASELSSDMNIQNQESEASPDINTQESVFAEVVRPVDGALADNFSRANGATPAGLFLAALAYAVGRWIQSEDVCLATVSSGRGDPGLRNSFGMFVRTLPLRLRVKEKGIVSSLDFVRACQQRLTDATLHERYPFTRVAQEWGFEPSILYACQIGLVEDRKVGGESARVEFLIPENPKFKIAVFAEERDGTPAYVVQYDSSLYSASLMERFAETLATAFENIAARPHAPLSEVSLMSDAARKLMEKFNDTGDGSPDTGKTLVEMFGAAVRANPDKTALIADDGEYAYSDLNERANRLANALLMLGVKKEDRIAFVLRRTSRVIVSMFGIMKAGCAYVPIDPDYPEERVRHVLSDGGVKFLLTTPDLRAAVEAALSEITETRALDFDSLVENASQEEPAASVTPDMLAYILFTSGSTGKPKGVMIEHRGIANFITDDPRNGYVRALTLGDCTMLSITTVAFDMFGIETLLPLCNGLTTVLADDETAKDPVRIAELFERAGADAIDSTPTRLLEYSEYSPLLDALRRCKVIVLGGEKYPSALLARLKKDRKHDSGLFNIYGPTEISVACNGKDLSYTNRITVGPPLLNVLEVVADSDGNALPPGVVGELWVGGRGVGRGYVNRPEQTAERFVLYEGERFYRCGDLARWTEDGEVEILGRNDNQIKLRGLRIELGEIESALSSIEGVRSCAVVIRNIRNSDHLCAYYAADAAETTEPAAVRERLARSLPPYMVPTAYLRLDSMPQTPNGKNDLRALEKKPEPELLKATGYEAPKTPLEEAICSVFASVLGLEKVGATDSFFDIGGSSLAVTRVIIEAREKGLGNGTGKPAISYSDVFAHPTPRELSALISGGGSATPPEQVHAEPDYDYSPIDSLLSRGTLSAFRDGGRRPLGNVLLTGATGFLGAHLLRALSGEDGAVFCLLRPGHEAVEARLRNMFFYYFEDDSFSEFGGRVYTFEGDITRSDSLAKLAGQPIDTIINCAANVTHFAKDTSISDVNLGGVLNLIEFAIKKKARLVQVSTASVAGFSVEGVPPKGTLMDETMLYFGQNLENQYVHSKFMAERAILEAIPKGLDAKIMRLGNLMGRNRDGEFQVNANANTFLGSLRAYLSIGCFPYSGCLERTDLSPIDSTAKAVLLLSKAPVECVVFHPFSANLFRMDDIMAAMNEEGLKIDLVEDDVFERALSDAMRDKARAEKLTSLIAYQNVAQGRAASTLGAANEYTSQALYRMGWRWPEASSGYLRKLLKGMISLGYFGATPGRPSV
ncbi:MAG: amino acid adenylation domain-containing protein [Synergistaceae bacterium]|jgi:amino acid adenylation domain-containing protein|nr:amino acid adenylation domain-containing protein [Synergistaceae bacterium]